MDLEARRLAHIVITATAVLGVAACEQNPVAPEAPPDDGQSAAADRGPLGPQLLSGPVLSSDDGQVFIGAGDIATCDRTTDDATADLVESLLAEDPDALVFTAGDNVYEDGTAQEYADCYAPTWGRFLDRTWATIGNHEYNLGHADPTFDYFGDRVGPRGLGYYSIDVGSWHVVMLNSNSEFVPLGPGSAQDRWLRADLAANTSPCVLAVFHHPRFFSSNSDGSFSSARVKPLWDALYEYGADLIVVGHAHHYERFAPQDPDGNLDLGWGLRQFIVGTGGRSVFSPREFQAPNSEVLDEGDRAFGVLKLTLHDSSYEWEFVPSVGYTFTDSGSAACTGASPPTVTITEPADDALFAEGDPVTFDGSAIDAGDVDLTSTLEWTSDRDGQIGTGGSFSTSSLSAGSHTITASVTDRDGGEGSDAITVSVKDPSEIVRVTFPSANGYGTFGGRHGDRHLVVTVTLVDGLGAPVSGARVSASIHGPTPGGGKRGTGASGAATFRIPNAAPGTYTTEVTDVRAAGYSWDGVTPTNSFTKH